MKSLSAAAVLAAVLSAAASTAVADTIYLKDGSKVQGDAKKGASGYVVNQGAGKYQVVPFDQVRSIELDMAPIAEPELARENLNSLRRSVEHQDDINRIIDRWQRFAEANQGTPVGEEAKLDLGMWKQRRDEGLVKYGGRWVTSEERARMQEEAIKVADNARRLLKQGRLNDAETVVNQALQQDPQNASALYLRGLIHLRQEQWPQARKAFEQVNQQVPNHGPTLNNLGLIHWRQNQQQQALGYYDQALISDPRNQQILNNVAEALYAVPDDQRNAQVAQRLARRFTEHDVDLQRELGKQGMHRWGAQWVTTEQLGELKTAERAMKDKLDQLSADFDGVKVRIDTIDREIGDNERAMRRLEASSYVRDYNGNIYQSVLPPTYYALQDDQRKLQRDREDQFRNLEKLRQQARAVQADLPVPKYTGMQRAIDVEGTPVQAPTVPAPATAPGTQPGKAQPATSVGNRTA
ncbi:MAG TPA: tetratricopeptide repeat protein [Tepidisphaeraceae bacterium]|nr:tetratricopeptide repeat protein [Tepidisphaeraceae bacterium]